MDISTEQFNTTMDSVLKFVDESKTLIESQQKQNEDLKSKVATLEKEKVVLEKVANSGSNKVTLDETLVSETLKQLVDRSLLSENSVEKVASELLSNPNAVLTLTQRILEVSSEAHSEGLGVKSASEKQHFNADDGWTDVLHYGAN